MSKVLCSTGALIGKPNNRDYRLLKDFSKKLNCDGYEFMMYSTWYGQEEEIIDFFKVNNFNIPVMHCAKGVGELISQGDLESIKEAVRLFAINCDLANKIGSKAMVLHLWGGIASDGKIDINIDKYKELADIAKNYDIDLLIENVVCNRENPMKHWVELAKKYPGIHFVYDTKMAAFHEQMDLLYQKDYEWLYKDNHIQHYHVNDYAGGYMDWANLKTLSMGKGHVDFDKFFEYVKMTGYDKTFTVEATAFNKEGVVDFDMLNSNFSKIRDYME